ncbi:hypothetical protein LWP59_36305 [Amycolatopsis acidiphila]|uniref:DUF6779 domain-containing protein n=2 Tax=Amycolatopsis acidiphila TaxID=715473 RepID=UPI00174BA901|nr:DUF6779 domain-containing protein [Amycolatopsis acidiphila]UIJ59443.1 hypothetical protein LWP59_36305 [Amycolatopsis acidiphila]
MTGVGDDSRGRLLGRPWFVVGLALALAATLALVLADDLRYLRLGIVAALWAALVGAFLAVKYRKQAASTEEAVAQAQEVYELELEREIAARREYELEVENDVRAKAHVDSRAELDALRAEVAALRDNLQSLFGGEVLLERFALTAQATRMRALREEQGIIESGGNGHGPPQLAAAERQPERPTELVDRVREKQQARPVGRQAAPEPRRPERSLDLPPRRVAKSEPMPSPPSRSGNAAASVAKAAAEARAEQTRMNPVAKKQEPAPRYGGSADATRPAFSPSERRRRQQPAPPAPQPPASVDEPTQLAKPVDADWTASWESPLVRDGSASDLQSSNGHGNTAPATPEPPAAARPPEPAPPRRAERSRPRMEPVQQPRFETSRPRMEPVQQPRFETSRPRMEPVQPRFETSRPRMEPVQQPRFETSRPRMEPVRQEAVESRFELSRPTSQPAQPPREEELPPPSNPTLPEEVRRVAQEGRSGGRRRRAEDEAPAEQPGGGRRRRPEGEPPAWETPSGGHSTGSHAKPEPGAGGHRSAEPTGRRAAPEEPVSGSHSAGRSVSDLLAAHGTTDAIPRRRRRAED